MKQRAQRGELFEFAEWAAKTSTDECILWPYGVTAKGYGLMSANGERVYAHRYVLQVVDPTDDGTLHALHDPDPETCFNRRCVNPRHLRWGTNAENIKDKITSGTDLKGEDHHCAKLTELEARAILASSEGPKVTALKYGVTPAAICDLRQGRTWKHIERNTYK